jgi:hypothetical protein
LVWSISNVLLRKSADSGEMSLGVAGLADVPI